MKPSFSYSMVNDVRDVTEAEFAKYVAVNVARLAEEIQARNVEDNVALEDIEVLILRIAEIWELRCFSKASERRS